MEVLLVAYSRRGGNPTGPGDVVRPRQVSAWSLSAHWLACAVLHGHVRELNCVSKQDRTIDPDLERFMAARMKATTIEVDAGHLSLVSHAPEVATLILQAAG